MQIFKTLTFLLATYSLPTLGVADEAKTRVCKHINYDEERALEIVNGLYIETESMSNGRRHDSITSMASSVIDEKTFLDFKKSAKSSVINFKDRHGKTALNLLIEDIFTRVTSADARKYKVRAIEVVLARGADMTVLEKMQSTKSVLALVERRYLNYWEQRHHNSFEEMEKIFIGLSGDERMLIIIFHAFKSMFDMVKTIDNLQSDCNNILRTYSKPKYKPILIADCHIDPGANIFLRTISSTLSDLDIKSIAIEQDINTDIDVTLQTLEGLKHLFEDRSDLDSLMNVHLLDMLRILKEIKLTTYHIDHFKTAIGYEKLDVVLSDAARAFLSFGYDGDLRDLFMQLLSLQYIHKTNGKLAIILGSSHIEALELFFEANDISYIGVRPYTYTSLESKKLCGFESSNVEKLYLPQYDRRKSDQNINGFKVRLQQEYAHVEEQCAENANCAPHI